VVRSCNFQPKHKTLARCFRFTSDVPKLGGKEGILAPAPQILSARYIIDLYILLRNIGRYFARYAQ
jgi:hypothetical protein